MPVENDLHRFSAEDIFYLLIFIVFLVSLCICYNGDLYHCKEQTYCTEGPEGLFVVVLFYFPLVSHVCRLMKDYEEGLALLFVVISLLESLVQKFPQKLSWRRICALFV